MKKIILIFALFCRQNIFSAHANALYMQHGQEISLEEMRLRLREAMSNKDLVYVEAILKIMSANSIDLNTISLDRVNNTKHTPLHYALDSKSPSLVKLVYKYFPTIDISLQDSRGHTVLMLAAENNEPQILRKLLFSELNNKIINFAIKNRESVNHNTVFSYAKNKPEIEKVIAEYDATYKKLMVSQVKEHSNLLFDLSKIIADYATPVNSEDIEADRAFEKEQWAKEFERECCEVDLGLPSGYLRNDSQFMKL